jgi:hypothetical protein
MAVSLLALLSSEGKNAVKSPLTAEVHRATLVILSVSTADVMTTDEFIARTAAAQSVAAAG